MGRLILCFLGIASTSTALAVGILSDIERYDNQSRHPKKETFQKCADLKELVNIPAVVRLNLNISCVQVPGGVVLTVPNSYKVTKSSLESGAFDPWLKRIYKGALKTGVGSVRIFMGGSTDSTRFSSLYSTPAADKAGGLSDWENTPRTLTKQSAQQSSDMKPVQSEPQALVGGAKEGVTVPYADLPPPPPLW